MKSLTRLLKRNQPPEPIELLGAAIVDRDAAAVRRILDSDPSLATRTLLGNLTPLMMATYYGHAEIVEALIVAGADMNAMFSGGVTALHVAARKGHEQVARILLSHGAAPDARNDEGETPLEMAVREGHLGVQALLRAC